VRVVQKTRMLMLLSIWNGTWICKQEGGGTA
jgi:hypothetical protein